jgi:1-aminocyclopropane-1-carboxylate deaminase/D-cysteine desulfhydrase-like pyridoxal-dependent ACC family enzyme
MKWRHNRASRRSLPAPINSSIRIWRSYSSNATTLVIVGSIANRAVLYTSFHASARGFTVVVAEDGISSFAPFNTFLTRHQLLQQPGFSNAANKPLAEKMVTLSRIDLITFK